MARRKSNASAQADRDGGKAGRDAPADPRSRYRIFPEKCRGGFRALTRVEETDPETGKTVEHIEDWGFATKDGFFMPGELYRETPERERRRLIFPLDWDLRELESLRALQRFGNRPQMPADDPEKPEASRLFGDVWLLEQAAKATGLEEDLAEAFEGDETLADHLLAAAMFLAAGHGPLRQMQHWHRVRAMRLTFPMKLDHLEETSSFCNAWSIEEFYRLRAARLAGRPCIAVESSVRAELDAPSGLRLAVGMDGSCERIPKVDVYALEDGMPVFSHAFLHSKRFGADLAEAMLGEIAKAGLEGTPLVTTLGAEDVRRLARLVRQGAPLVMPTDLHQPHVARALRRFPPDKLLRESMEIDGSNPFNTILWYRQFAIGSNYAVIDDTSDEERLLNLHLFYDDRINSLLKHDYIISFFYRKSNLESIVNNATKIESDNLSEYDDEIFDIEYDEKHKLIKSFSTCGDVENHEHKFSGLYAVTITPVVKYDSINILEIVNLAYKKTTSCEAMLARCYDDVDNRELLDLHKEVFHLLIFLAQTLLAFLESVRREKLAARYKSVADMLGEMQDIRWVEHEKDKPAITVLTDRQRAVCWAFDFECPDLCPPPPRSRW